MKICGHLRHLGSVLLFGASLHAEVRLRAFGEIPPNACDQLGDTIGGLGSAVASDARTGDVFLMPDRGAGDGTIDFRPRIYRVTLARRGATLDARVVETILLRDERGRPFSGLTAAPAGRRHLDPESLAIAPDGSFYVGDEYAPALLHFTRRGRLLRTVAMPVWYRPRPGSGRTENQGIEAMGLLPDGTRAVIIFQSALAQDGGRDAGISRVLVLDLRSGTPLAEYAYAFSRPFGLRYRDLSINDLAVIDDHRLLVLERDGRGRSGAAEPSVAGYKSVWLVDLSRATNLLEVAPAGSLSLNRKQDGSLPHFRPVRKKRLFNLPDLVGQLGLSRPELAAKWEGLALLPAAPGILRILMTADNDFVNPTLIFNGVTHPFPRAQKPVPTQLAEIIVTNR